MTITHLWGALIIFLVCPIIGAIPLIDWLTYAVSGKELAKLGTGNISVSAAFYHGGKLAGILAVLSEAGKGIGVILLARAFFPVGSTWEIMALIALVMGRYWGAKGAGATNVTWGIVAHNPVAAILIFLIGGIGFTILREKQTGRIGILILMVVVLSAQNINNPEYIFMTIALASLLIWIYQQIPDDLELNPNQVNRESAKMFSFFRGDHGIISLNQKLTSDKAGGKAGNLSQLKQWGYNVPDGWVITAGDDVGKLIEFLQPSSSNPLVVRSSALDEDSLEASAAGIYVSFLNITDTRSLQQAILNCFHSYHSAIARDYRANNQIPDKAMAVIVQQQINGLFSGVAFSRDPVNQLQDSVCIESVMGEGLQLVSGEVTPEQYKVYFPDETVEGEGETPPEVIKQIAQIVREIERVSNGIPQDVEWTYDGEQLWLLQTRPITTLQPLWTRKIAAEVIPGVIRPLTWSINQPLTCGVWGDIFTLVLGKKAAHLDFNQTATLHYHRAYFNATLLGDIFRLMGLPPESLDFLTRGSKFTKPPVSATLSNLGGLWRLLQRELNLVKDFAHDCDQDFAPILDELNETTLDSLSYQQLLTQIDTILLSLKKATYYSILAPLSYALRQAILKVDPHNLDNQNSPEITSLNTLKQIAIDTRNLFSENQLKVLQSGDSAAFFAYLAESKDGKSVLNLLQSWLEEYGYLSETATDIAVPRWQEDQSPMRVMFTKFITQPVSDTNSNTVSKTSVNKQTWKEKNVQTRLNLKGKVTATYSQLSAHLRYSFLAIEKQFINQQVLSNEGDIFFLTLPEIRNYIQQTNSSLNLNELSQQRKFQWLEDGKIKQIPYLIYGNAPSINLTSNYQPISSDSRFTGIPASAGIIEGKIKVIRSLTEINNIQIDRHTIIVVPYTDSGWSPILAQAGGLIAEVGGQLSHGAIIAREYGIPAVMDIHHATDIFQDNQQVRIDGQKGTVEILA